MDERCCERTCTAYRHVLYGIVQHIWHSAVRIVTVWSHVLTPTPTVPAEDTGIPYVYRSSLVNSSSIVHVLQYMPDKP